MSAIDIDRGVLMRQIVRFHKDNPNKFEADPAFGGMQIYMYKDDPGRYYDTHGREIPMALAERAGFETTKHSKIRRKREAMKDFEDRLAQELALEQDEVIILAEAGDWQVIALPMERAKIIDKETGEMVTSVPLPRADALTLLANLAATEIDATPDPKEK